MRAPGFHADVPEADYHADRDSLSVTGAKTLLKAPALFKWQQDHPVHKDVFDFGTAAHALVLGVGAPLEVIDADSWRSKAAQEARDAARARHATPLLAADHERVMAMADRLSSHKLAMTLLSDGAPEVSAYAEDNETGVIMRGRFDWLGSRIVVDYKSCASANPTDWSGRYGTVRKFGYDLQAEWYLDLARRLGHPARAFAWIAQEKEPPYLVSVIYADETELADAADRNALARSIFAECMSSGRWPGYLADDHYAQVRLDSQAWQAVVA